MRSTLPIVIFLSTVVFSCASINPIKTTGDIPLEYHSEITSSQPEAETLASFQKRMTKTTQVQFKTVSTENSLSDQPIKVDVQVLRTTRKIARQILDTKIIGTFATGVKTEDAESFIDKIIVNDMGKMVYRPCLIINNKEQGSFSSFENISYVGSFQIECAKEALIAEPVVKVAKQGIILELEPEYLHKSNTIKLDLSLTLSNLLTPITNIRVPIIQNECNITLQGIVTNTQKLKLNHEIPVGGTFLIAGLSSNDSDDVFLTFIKSSLENTNG